MTQDNWPSLGGVIEGMLRVGQLIDAAGGPPLHDAMVRVEGGRITAVGAADAFGSAGAHALDLGAERVLMPGLVDCHAHPTLFLDRQDFEVQLTSPDEMLALTAVRQLTVHLRSGVTTVRDCAARGKTMFWVREAICRGFFAGPRLQLPAAPLPTAEATSGGQAVSPTPQMKYGAMSVCW